MKLTKSHLKEIIREVIKEEDESSQKTIQTNVENLNYNDLRRLTLSLTTQDPADFEPYMKGLIKKVAVTATPDGIKRAMKQLDKLYDQIMGPLDDPEMGFPTASRTPYASKPSPKVLAAAKKLVLKLATIATA